MPAKIRDALVRRFEILRASQACIYFHDHDLNILATPAQTESMHV